MIICFCVWRFETLHLYERHALKMKELLCVSPFEKIALVAGNTLSRVESPKPIFVELSLAL